MAQALSISSSQWLWPCIALALLFLGLVIWLYRRASLPPRLRVACIVLKVLGISLLLLCLLEPLWSTRRPKPGANVIAVLADNSLRMTLLDPPSQQSRGSTILSTLSTNSSRWREPLEEQYSLKTYRYDSRLEHLQDLNDLNFRGSAAHLGKALEDLGQRYRGQPLAGVVVLTDGQSTDVPNLTALKGFPPIYPVMVGRESSLSDLALDRLTITQTPFDDAPVTVQAEVGLRGSGVGPVRVAIRELRSSLASTNPAGTAPSGISRTNAATATESNAWKSIQESTVQPKPGRSEVARFQFRPTAPGTLFYEVQVTGDSARKEATPINNRGLVSVDRASGPYRILYVSGRPNWEFKFLNRSLLEDDQLELVGLIRLAKREPKFEFRGHKGETANPLFRGFDKTDDDTERYDQPVLLRLNTRDEQELRSGFPNTEEELFSFHAVVLDDLEAAFFTRDQMALLQKFVSQRGGGLLMLGGQETFSRGRYHNTPIGEMLPIYLDRPQPAQPDSTWTWSLSREGWLQPWTRLRPNESNEKIRLESMPRFKVLSQVGAVKPGASVLAAASDQKGRSVPALVAQRFGEGRTAALPVGDWWRWGLRDPEKQVDMAKAWRQLARWLVVDVPPFLQVEVKPSQDNPSELFQITVRAKDKKFQPLDNATVQLTLQRVATLGGGSPSVTNDPARPEAFELPAEPVSDESGAYQATFAAREPGAYRVEAKITDSEGQVLGTVMTGWVADPLGEQFRNLNPNRSLLESLARTTGGKLLTADDLPSLAGLLTKKNAPIMEATALPLWHQPWLFLSALMCFALEWGIRRHKGLP